jgi:hypothetical protein
MAGANKAGRLRGLGSVRTARPTVHTPAGLAGRIGERIGTASYLRSSAFICGSIIFPIQTPPSDSAAKEKQPQMNADERR